MKFVNVKFIEILSDGTVIFSYKGLKTFKQHIFYEKDAKSFSFFKKPTKEQLFQNSSQNFYKSKYKF